MHFNFSSLHDHGHDSPVGEWMYLTVCPLRVQGHDSSLGEGMHLTVWHLCGPGSTLGCGGVFQGIFLWLVTHCQPVLSQGGREWLNISQYLYRQWLKKDQLVYHCCIVLNSLIVKAWSASNHESQIGWLIIGLSIQTSIHSPSLLGGVSSILFNSGKSSDDLKLLDFRYCSLVFPLRVKDDPIPTELGLHERSLGIPISLKSLERVRIYTDLSKSTKGSKIIYWSP